MTITADSKTEIKTKLSIALENVKKWPVSVEIIEGAKARSVDQNRLQHKHYAQIGTFQGLIPVEAKNFCKLTFGIPILLQRNPESKDYISFEFLDYLDYEMQLNAIQSVDVTSLFTTREAKEYTDNMMVYWSNQGLALTDPNDRLLKYWEEEIAKEEAKKHKQ